MNALSVLKSLLLIAICILFTQCTCQRMHIVDIPSKTIKLNVYSNINGYQNRNQNEIRTSIRMINRYFKELNLKFEFALGNVAHYQYTGNNVGKKNVVNDFNRRINLPIDKNNWIVLLANEGSFIETAKTAEYYDTKQGHYILGSENVLEDPLLFLHEFIHQVNMGHVNMVQDKTLNVLAECYSFFNYSITESQIYKAHNLCSNSSKIYTPIQPPTHLINAVYSGCINLNTPDLYDDVIEDDNFIDLNNDLCYCNHERTRAMIATASAPSNGRSANPTRSIDPYMHINMGVFEKLLKHEYDTFLAGHNIITYEEFKKRKLHHLTTTRKKNTITNMKARILRVLPNYSFSDQIYTNDNLLSNFLNDIIDKDILSDYPRTNLKSLTLNTDDGTDIDLKNVEFAIKKGNKGRNISPTNISGARFNLELSNYTTLIIKHNDYNDKTISISEIKNNDIITLSTTTSGGINDENIEAKTLVHVKSNQDSRLEDVVFSINPQGVNPINYKDIGNGNYELFTDLRRIFVSAKNHQELKIGLAPGETTKVTLARTRSNNSTVTITLIPEKGPSNTVVYKNVHFHTYVYGKRKTLDAKKDGTNTYIINVPSGKLVFIGATGYAEKTITPEQGGKYTVKMKAKR